MSPATACAAHPERPAAAACITCSRPLCAACRCRGSDAISRCARHHRARVVLSAPPQPSGHGRLLFAVLTVVGAVILGVLVAGSAAVRLRAQALGLRNQAAMNALGFSLDDFFLDVGRYPTAEEGLAALVTGDPDGDGSRIPGWRGPYLRLDGARVRYDRLTGTFLDAWGNPVLYWADPEQLWVYAASAGADGRFDTEGLGTPAFSGLIGEGDDVIIWAEGP